MTRRNDDRGPDYVQIEHRRDEPCGSDENDTGSLSDDQTARTRHHELSLGNYGKREIDLTQQLEDNSVQEKGRLDDTDEGVVELGPTGYKSTINPSTFDAPTWSSMAKQNEKVELHSIVRHGSTTTKAPLSRQTSVASRRLPQHDVEGHDFPIREFFRTNNSQMPPFLREWKNRQPNHNRDELSRPTIGRKRSSITENLQPETTRELANDLSDTHLGDMVESPTSSEEPKQTLRFGERDERVFVPPHDTKDEDDLAVSEVEQRGIESEVSSTGLLEEPQVMVVQAQGQLDRQQQQDEVLQQELADSQQNTRASRDKVRIFTDQDEKLQQAYDTPKADLQLLDIISSEHWTQKPPPVTLEAALADIGRLHVMLTEFNQMKKESEDVNDANNELYDEKQKLELDLQALTKFLDEKSENMLQHAIGSSVSTVSIKVEELAPDAQAHAVSIFQLFSKFDELMEGARNPRFQSVGEFSDETYNNRKDKQHDATKEELRNTAAEKDLLFNENDRLCNELKKCRIQNCIYGLQAGLHRKRAWLWKQEAELAQEELSKRTSTFEEEWQGQQEEMLQIMADYHTKTKDESHWNLHDLQTQVKAMEHEIRQMNQLFHQTKSDKARLEDAFTRLTVEDDRKAKYIEKNLMLGEGFPLPSFVPGLDEVDDASSDSSFPSSPRLEPTTSPTIDNNELRFPPRFLMNQEKCVEIMQQFRDEQKKKRLEERAMDRLMENLRKYRMGVMKVSYPPDKSNWKSSTEKIPFERWEGARWRLDVKLTAEEEELVRNLRLATTRDDAV